MLTRCTRYVYVENNEIVRSTSKESMLKETATDCGARLFIAKFFFLVRDQVGFFWRQVGFFWHMQNA